MIFDAHCHAWRRWPYTADVPDPTTRGDAGQLLSMMDRHGVDRALVVAAGIGAGDPRTDNTDNNTDVAVAVAGSAGRLVWVADVDSRWSPDYRRPGGAERVRVALTDSPWGGTALGITHYCADEVDDWFDTAEGDGFLDAVGERVLSVHLPAPWIAPFVEVARRHPAPVIMVHHQGHVRPADHDHLAALLRLMELENVHLKVSGFPYLAERTWDYPFPAEHETLRRVVDHVGADRLLWGSDFPVSAADLSYRQTIEVVREHCDFLTETELDAVMGGTLARLVDRVAGSC